MVWYVILFIVVSALILILYGIYLYFFLLNLIYRGREYRIKEKFDELTPYYAINNFSFVTSLSNKNSRFSEANEYFKKMDYQRKKAIKILKDRVRLLTECNKSGDYRNSKKLIATINYEFDQIIKQLQLIKDKSEGTILFNKSIRPIISEYKDYFFKCSRYYEEKVVKILDTPKIYELQRQVEGDIINIEKKLDTAEREELAELLEELHDDLYGYSKIVYHTPKLDFLISKYIKPSLLELEKNLASAIKNSLTVREKSVKDSIRKVRAFLDECNDYRKKFDYENCDRLIVVILNGIYEPANHLKTELLSYEMFPIINEKIMDPMIWMIEHRSDVESALTKIESEASGDKVLLNYINTIRNDLNRFNNFYDEFQTMNDRKDSLKSAVIQRIHSTFNFYKTVRTNLRELDDYLTQKYSLSSRLIPDIVKNRMLIEDIYLKSREFETQEVFKRYETILNNTRDEFERLSHLITTGDKISERHYSALVQRVIDLWINLDSFRRRKNILTNIIMYLNKYQNEDSEIRKYLGEIRDYYEKQNYDKGIKVAIQLIKKINKSANEFHLTIS